jgi:hypothetical protein
LLTYRLDCSGKDEPLLADCLFSAFSVPSSWGFEVRSITEFPFFEDGIAIGIDKVSITPFEETRNPLLTYVLGFILGPFLGYLPELFV